MSFSTPTIQTNIFSLTPISDSANKDPEVGQLRSMQNGKKKRDIVDLTRGKKKVKNENYSTRKNKSFPKRSCSAYPQPLFTQTQNTNQSSHLWSSKSVSFSSSKKRPSEEKEMPPIERSAPEITENQRGKIPRIEGLIELRKSIEADGVNIDEVFCHIEKLKNDEKEQRTKSAPSGIDYIFELKILEAILNLHLGECEKAQSCLDFPPYEYLLYVGLIISTEHVVRTCLIRIRALNDLCIMNSLQSIECCKKEFNISLEKYYNLIVELKLDHPVLDIEVKIERAKTLNIKGYHYDALTLLRSIKSECLERDDPNIFGRFQSELALALFECENKDEACEEIAKIQSAKVSKNILAWSYFHHSKFLFRMDRLPLAKLILNKAFEQECPNKNIKFLLSNIWENIDYMLKSTSECKEDSDTEPVELKIVDSEFPF